MLAKNTRGGADISSSGPGSSVDHFDDFFDPLYESDEIDDEEYFHHGGGGDVARNGQVPAANGPPPAPRPTGFIPTLIRTATDDLKLVGNVLKMALS